MTCPDLVRATAHQRAMAAAQAARTRYPGPVGDILVAEIKAWGAFGHRLGHPHAPVARLIRQLTTGQHTAEPATTGPATTAAQEGMP